MFIHFVFTFQKTFNPLVSTILASMVNSRWHFQELEKYPYNVEKRSSNFETIGQLVLNYKVGFVCHIIDFNEID
jgi:hypothetical protein